MHKKFLRNISSFLVFIFILFNTIPSSMQIAFAEDGTAPVISGLADVSLDEDKTAELSFTVSDADSVTEAGAIQVTASSSNTEILDNLSPQNSSGHVTIAIAPKKDQNGNVTVSITAKDSDGNVAAKDVTVSIRAINDAPVAKADSASTDEDKAVTIKVLDNDTDADGDTLHISAITKAPEHGTAEENSGAIVYTPSADWHGTDTLTYEVSDGNGEKDTANVTIEVASVNDKPVAETGSYTTDEGQAVEITLKATDKEGDTLRYILADTSDLKDKGTLSEVSGDKVTFTPVAYWNGDTYFTYKANDGTDDSSAVRIDIHVNSVNDAPVSDNINKSTDEDTAIEITLQSHDPDGDSLSYSITDQSGVDGKGTLGGIDNGKVTYTPKANWHGSVTFKYKTNDGKVDSNEATVTITVAAVDDPPAAVDDTASLDEDGSATIGVIANDTDIDLQDEGSTEDLTVKAVADPAHGTATISEDKKSVIYTPDANWNGSETFDYTVTDTAGKTASAHISVTVKAVNDVPVAVNDAFATDEDTETQLDVLANDTDPDLITNPADENLTITAVTQPAHGTVTVAGDGKTVFFAPAANVNGDQTFTYTISDKDGKTSQATVTVTVKALNDAPLAVNDTASINEDGHTTIEVTKNDTDPDLADAGSMEDLTVKSVDIPLHGTAVISEDKKSVTYTPNANWNGIETFSYTVSDTGGKQSTAQITVTVAPVNDAPVAVADTATTDEDTPVNIKVLENDTDADLITNPEDEDLTIVAVIQPEHGTASIAADGKSIDFTPEANMNGFESFTYTVKDKGGELAGAQVTVTINFVNDAPVAVNDTAAVDEDGSVSIDVVSNDTDADLISNPADEALTIKSVETPAHGTAVITTDKKSIIYTPNANWNGSEVFNYTVQDAAKATSNASVTVAVKPVNDAPVAKNDTYTFNEDESQLFNVLSNDTDIDFSDEPMLEAHTIISVSTPSHGTATIEDNKIRYIPAANWFGTDSFTYTLEDKGKATATATVSVTAVSVNDSPQFANISTAYSTDEDTPLTISFDVSDVETATESLMLQCFSSNQTLLPDSRITVNGLGTTSKTKSITVNPNPNANGTTTLTLRLSDGFLISNYTITLTVNPVNDAPVANTDSYGFTEDTPVILDMDDFVSNDTDVEGNTLTFDSYTLPEGFQGTLTVQDEGQHKYLYTPPANFNGTATFNYKVSDGAAKTEGTVKLIGTAVNDAPTIAMDGGYPTSTNEDTVQSGIGFTVGDVETPFANLVVTASSSDRYQIEDGGISIVRGENGHCNLVIHPNADKYGKSDISITVSDGTTATTQTFSFDIISVEDKPVAVNDTYAMGEDTSLSLAPLENDYDRDGDTLSIVSINGDSGSSVATAHGTVNKLENNTLIYIPNPGYDGTESFTYTISDNCGKGCDPVTATVTINISGENDPPHFAPIADQKIDEDKDTGLVTFVMQDPDGGDTATYTATSSNTDLLPDANISVDGEAKTIKCTPAPNANGSTTVTLKVTDKGGLTDTVSFNLTVRPVNDEPVLADLSSVSVTEDTAKTIDILSGASDVDGDTLKVVSISSVQHGTMAPAGEGKYTYTPNWNYNGADSFTYTVTDGSCLKTGTASITVQGVNDVPIAYDNYLDVTMPVSSATTEISPLNNDYDYDTPYGDSISLDSIVTEPTNGSAVISGNNIIYTPNASSSARYDTIKYRVKDTAGATADATIHIARTDSFGTYSPIAFGWTDIILEDAAPKAYSASVFDADSSTYTISIDTQPTKGTITVDNTAKTMTYTPNANANGSDSFKYLVTDPDGNASNVATVSISITPVNDAPVISALSDVTVDEDTASSPITVTFGDVETATSDLLFSVYGDNEKLLPESGIQTTKNEDGTVTLTLTPGKDENGTTKVNVVVSDRMIKTVQSFNFNVTSKNDAPDAKDYAITTNEEVPIDFAVKSDSTDVDNTKDEIAVEIATQPGHGAAAVNGDGTLKYTPNKDYFGSDSFTYKLTDKDGATDTGTITCNVLNVNDTPVISGIDYVQKTMEDTDKTVNFKATDADGEALTLTAVSSNQTLLPDGNITLGGSGSDRTITLHPTANNYGIAFVTIKADDGIIPVTYEFELTVLSQNDLPTAADDSATLDEDTSKTVNLTANDSDLEDTTVSVISLTNPAHGTVVNNQDGTVTYTPASNYYGTDEVTYTVSDTNEGTATAKLSLTINPVNDAPNANNDSATMTEDGGTISMDVFANDSDVDNDKSTLSITGYGTPSKGTIELVDGPKGKIKYTPNLDQNGQDSFTYTLSDGELTSTGHVYINITAVNDAPRVNAVTDDPFTFDEDTTGLLKLNIYDPEMASNNLITQVTSSDQSIIKDTGIRFIGSGQYRDLELTPVPNKNGSLTIDITVSDGVNTTAYHYHVTVASVNDAPTLSNSSATVEEDKTATGSVQGTDVETAAASLGYSLDDGAKPAHGTATVNANGTWSYTPDANYNGTDSFGIIVNDNDPHDAPLTGKGTVTVTVTPVNDAPHAVNDTASTDEDTALTIHAVANDTDPDLNDTASTEELTIKSVTQPEHGTAAIDSNSKDIVYTPDANYNGTDSFTYVVKDKAGQTSTASAAITVNSVNDAPTAENDGATIDEDTATLIDVLVNDLDVDLTTNPSDETHSIKSVGLPTHGTAVIEDKKIKYTPDANYFGSDSFTYTMADAAGSESSASVSITVNSVNDAPQISGIASQVEIDEDKDTGALEFTVSDVEDTSSALTVTAVSGNVSLLPQNASNIMLGGTDGLRTVKLIPKADMNGNSVVTLTVKDSNNATGTLVFTLKVDPVNDAPVAKPDTATTVEDTAKTIDVLANDTDIDLTTNPADEALTVKSVDTPAHGTAVISGNKIVYTPSANYNGTDSFTYTASDKAGATSVATVSMTITPVNDAPLISGITGPIAIDEDSATDTLDFAVSDVEDAASVLTVTAASSNTTILPVANIVLGGSGGARTVKATPAANQNGTVNITLTVKDSANATHTMTFTLNVQSINDTPVANTDTVTTSEDTQKNITVMANDTDVDLTTNPGTETLTLASVTQPSHGTAEISGNTVNYIPASNYNGSDSFTYTIKDAANATATGTVNITVTAVNDSPAANADLAGTDEDTPVTVNVISNDTDVDLATNPGTESLTVVSVSSPAHGTASIDSGSKTVTYTPNANWNGTDTFTYTMKDAANVQKTASVTVTVAAVNDPPQPVNDTASVDEDNTVAIDALGNDTDVDLATNPADEALSLVSVSDPAHGTAQIKDGKITYTPAANYNGADSFTYTMKDKADTERTATVDVTVNSVNDAPSISSATASVETDEDTATDEAAFTISDVEDAASALVISANSSNTSLIPEDTVHNIILGGENGSRTVHFVPKANMNGTAVVTLTVTDSGGLHREISFTVKVNAINDAPTAVDDSTGTSQDTAVTIDALANDTDPDLITNPSDEALTITGVGTPAHGTAEISGNKIVYTPESKYAGSDSFTYNIKDKAGLTSSATVYVSMGDQNDPPTANDDTMNTSEDTPVTENLITNDTDPDLQNAGSTENLTIVSVTQPAHGTVAINAGNKTVTYTPSANWNGTDTFNYTIKDTGNLQKTAKVTVNVAPVNDAPVANADSATIDEDEPAALTVLNNDTDADLNDAGSQEVLKIAEITQPAHGKAVISSNGYTILYTPDANYYGTDTLTYKAQDRIGQLSGSADVSITVNWKNDAPEAKDDLVTILEDAATKNIAVLANDTDTDIGNAPSAETMTLTAISGQPAHGTAVIAKDGTSVDYTPNADFNGADSFGYTITDASGSTAAAEVYITIQAVNDAPKANDDNAEIDEDSPSILNVLGNDTDADLLDAESTEKISVASVTTPGHGTAQIQEDGTIKYTPAANYNGTDSFTYTAEDKAHVASVATVTVTVKAVDDAPVANKDTVSTDEDTPVTIEALANDTDVDLATNPADEEITIQSVGMAEHGTASVSVDKKTITYTPDADFNGEDTFTYTVSDKFGLTATGTVAVTVKPVNDLPEAINDAYSIDEDSVSVFDVLANDKDADLNDNPSSEQLTIVSVTTPTHGTATIEKGKIVYKINKDCDDSDSFDYTMQDHTGATSSATVTITVNPVNDPPSDPVFVQPVKGTFYKKGQTVHVSWTPSTDVDADAITYKLEFYNGTDYATVAQKLGTNEYDFTVPDENLNTQNAKFRVQAADEHGLTSDKAQSAAFIIDNAAPAKTLLTLSTGTSAYTPGTWTNQNVLVKLINTEDVLSFTEQMRVTKDGAAAGWQETNTVLLNTTGAYTVEYSAKDALENQAAVKSAKVLIDTIAPPVPDIRADITRSTNGNVTLTASLTADKGGSGNATVTLPDGKQVKAGSEASYAVSENGTYTFTLTDHAGNAASAKYTVTNIERDAPSVTVDNNGYTPDTWTNRDIDATLIYRDGTSSVAVKQYAVNGSKTGSNAWKSYTDDVKISSDGVSYIHYNAKDSAGNTASGVFGTYKLDKVKPVLTVQQAGDASAGYNLSYAADDSLSGLQKVVLPDGTNAASAKGSYKVAKNGDYTFKAIDEAGNENNVVIHFSPNITDDSVQAAAENIPVQNGGNVVSISGGFAGSDVEVTIPEGKVDAFIWTNDPKVDNTQWKKLDGTVQIDNSQIPEGVWYLHLKKDGKITTVKYVVDRTPPEIKEQSTGFFICENVVLTAVDHGSGMDRLEGDGLKGTDRVEKLYFWNGDYTFKAYDKAGNMAVYTVKVGGLFPWWIILLLIIIFLFILWKRRIYKTGQKPGKGRYFCMKCRTDQYVRDKEQELVDCMNCGYHKFRKRKFK